MGEGSAVGGQVLPRHGHSPEVAARGQEISPQAAEPNNRNIPFRGGGRRVCASRVSRRPIAPPLIL
ncbi:hypothetical protein SFR_4529 [Streptomyces sp. FR-008]|nr:hypothetical protein SFR_4529 [Streptomyces sp. FR-008]